MVDELDDLKQCGLFNCREIAKIVKQRRKFEYRLKHSCPLKNQGNKKLKKSKSNVAGLLKIMEIYELALKRYKGDMDLWFRYLESLGGVSSSGTYLPYNKLKARKVALGEDEGTLTRDDEKQWRDENKELFMFLDEKVEGDDIDGTNVGITAESEMVSRDHVHDCSFLSES
ncbi:uncharacterized protein HKW66_Vig0237560 [Vigna angularis]|uniref:U3 small nucleolar RNA-associated protein 6 N-terminal domain-containing protein n=1 Tax=Phaseolus angularis TaxID=3914 RepID=A0A8T0KTJ0_PHAAN|nr:uncharacterized protein HKW66_Vig0237560 [Vigna angularis]